MPGPRSNDAAAGWTSRAFASPSDALRVAVDPRYFRPTAVELQIGDPAKALAKLDWSPTTTVREPFREMVEADLLAMRSAPIGRDSC